MICSTDAVAGVSLIVPTVAIEGQNVSLSCTWTAGTQVTVQWGLNGAAVTASSRITISAGSLVINPASRSDAGTYTCTVSNPVSAQTATQSLTVYCEFTLIETSGSQSAVATANSSSLSAYPHCTAYSRLKCTRVALGLHRAVFISYYSFSFVLITTFVLMGK